MRSFRTDFVLKADSFLTQERPILTLGSCFAEHMGQKLLDFKWRGLSAPFGTLFHPLALSKVLRLSVTGGELDPELFVEHDGAVFHYDLHSRFFGKDSAALQASWRSVAARVQSILMGQPCVLLTLGTAWVYQLKTGGQVVANCHKRPMDQFEKRLLTAEEIQESLETILDILPESSPLVVSLSPVRHTRDSMVLNSLSKSLLLVTIHAFQAKYPQRVRYFPAYEIMLDDLRDYRFYEADMIHPSAVAIDYIWEKFADCYLSDASKKFLQRWQSLQSAFRHRPQRLDAPSYQKHLLDLLQELDSLEGLDLSQEKAELKSRLLS